MKDKFPSVLVIFLTRYDLTSHYDKLAKEEAVFYKPLDQPSLFEVAGPRLSGKRKNAEGGSGEQERVTGLTAPVQASPTVAGFGGGWRQ